MLGLSKEDFRAIDKRIEPEELQLFRRLRELEPKAPTSYLLSMARDDSGTTLIKQMKKYGGTMTNMSGTFRSRSCA